MIHFKSKSTKIKEDTNNEEEKVNSDNDYVSTTVNQINSTKDNLSLNTLTDENYGKISSLLFEQDNNDKIVNISKLDESLCYNDKNTKRENNEQDIQQSNYEFIIKNITNNEENNNSNPVINISCLETQNNENKSDNNNFSQFLIVNISFIFWIYFLYNFINFFFTYFIPQSI